MNDIHLSDRILFSPKEQNYVICKEINEAGTSHVKQNKPNSEKQQQKPHFCLVKSSLKLKDEKVEPVGSLNTFVLSFSNSYTWASKHPRGDKDYQEFNDCCLGQANCRWWQ